MDDVIERIERLSINDEAPPADQPGPSRKTPKWATKTLESVHPDEVGKTGTRSSKRHEDGGGADHSYIYRRYIGDIAIYRESFSLAIYRH